MAKVLELKGYKSLRALNGFHALMLGLKMLPMYATETYEDFYKRMEAMPDSEKESYIRQAASFVELKKDEVEAMASFCTDENGVPYEKSNINNLKPNQLHDVLVSVSMEFLKMDVGLITEGEKKN